jgi:Ca-activated chloride channel family protein
MSFAAPLALLTLLLVPAGFALQHAARGRRRRTAVRFPAAATLAAVMPGVNPWRRRLPALLLALAAVALALALARPQTEVAVAVERASVMLVLDGSRSMLSEDVDPTRMDAARKAARTFVDAVPDGLQVGLVGYNTVPYLSEPPTLEHDQILAAIDSLQADGGTATGDAVNEALRRLRPRGREEDDRGAPAAIVLLSDGKSTDGEDPVTVARRAGQSRVPIFTVALGTPEGVVPGGPFGAPLAVPPDPETLRRMAAVSGGRAFEIADSSELSEVYERLGSQLGTKTEKREITSGFAGAGLLLLLGAVATMARWRGRVA